MTEYSTAISVVAVLLALAAALAALHASRTRVSEGEEHDRDSHSFSLLAAAAELRAAAAALSAEGRALSELRTRPSPPYAVHEPEVVFGYDPSDAARAIREVEVRSAVIRAMLVAEDSRGAMQELEGLAAFLGQQHERDAIARGYAALAEIFAGIGMGRESVQMARLAREAIHRG